MSERVEPDERLVSELVASQFPRWAHLPVTQVKPGGNDNRTFRLGDELAVRMPSAAGYVPAIAKEQRWLPHLAPHLSAPVPTPVGQGAPGLGYPWPWSVNAWLEGETLTHDTVDRPRFARDIAAFLGELRAIDATGGPAAGAHSFYRGASLAHYDSEARAAAGLLPPGEKAAANRVLDAALASAWTGDAVWFHGDIAHGNVLVRDGALAAVIDFGTSGVGDPACDLVIAWTFFEGADRAIFRDAVGLDDDTWARARGWCVWKALITVAEPDHPSAGEARRALTAALDDELSSPSSSPPQRHRATHPAVVLVPRLIDAQLIDMGD